MHMGDVLDPQLTSDMNLANGTTLNPFIAHKDYSAYRSLNYRPDNCDGPFDLVSSPNTACFGLTPNSDASTNTTTTSRHAYHKRAHAISGVGLKMAPFAVPYPHPVNADGSSGGRVGDSMEAYGQQEQPEDLSMKS